MTFDKRMTRRTLLAVAVPAAAVGVGAKVLANGGSGLPSWGDASSDGLKAGPLGLNPTLDAGQVPVAISIPDAEVDAEVEQQEIVNGQMLDPSGPWVVSWYRQTSPIGARGNTVMSGHVDYWGVGPSVFYTVADLQEGAEITVTGENGTQYVYEVEYVERVELASLTGERLNSPEMVGKTDYPALTLVTCGGDFNGTEYLSRDIIRGRLTSTVAADGTTTEQSESGTSAEEGAEGGEEAPAGELVEGGTATVNDTEVNLRPNPSLEGDPIQKLDEGTVVTITGPSQEAEGYTWWPIQLEDGTEGWIVEDFLTPSGE